LSAVLVFFMSSLVHMVLPWHKGDYPKLPNEDAVMDAIRPLGLQPGDYCVPRADSMAEMKSPAYKEKISKGPVFFMTVRPNAQHGMTAQFVNWFLYTVVVGIFAGYVAGRALPPGSDYLHVFRFAGVTAFVAYAMALPQISIWYGRAWRITLTSMFDGLIYALLTAGAFGWLWPK
jgi:hypothetical protein